MVTNEERIKILQMVDEGKISAEEGARLLTAFADTNPRIRKPDLNSPTAKSRWLRVRVTDMETGKSKATVNLPLGLLDAGLNIASKYAPDIAFDELIESINQGAEGKIIDVLDEEDREHVEIFID